jgi:hypothetical protein
MITVKDVPYPYYCNACMDKKSTKEVTFVKNPKSGSGIVIVLCDECIKELKEALKLRTMLEYWTY